MSNIKPNQIANKNLVKKLDEFLRYTESTTPLIISLNKMLMVYLEQRGSIFSLSTGELNDIMFLTKFLEDCNKYKE